MPDVPFITVHELASWISEKEKIAILDIRSFREYYTSHISSALNVGGDRAFKRKLLANAQALGPFVSQLVGASIDDLCAFKKLVIYDECSAETPSVYSDSFTFFVISRLSEIFSNLVLLQGGFLGFRAAYPRLCWQHPDKLPDEEFVGVKGDSGLVNLLEECLLKRFPEPTTSSLSPEESSNASTRHASSCSSSCRSSYSQQSCDSGVVLTVPEIASRKFVSRVTSAPINRPNTVQASLSVDDVIMAGSTSSSTSAISSRRPSRMRPNTLSLLSASYSSCFSKSFSSVSSTNASTSTLHDPLLFACCSSSASTTSANERLLSPPPERATVSGALSAEAFESPQPTAVLPHLLIGCQGDAMSRGVCAEFGVTHVINVSVDGEASPHVTPSNFLRVPIHDNGKADIVPYFEQAFAFIDSAKASGGRVLVHCFAGISRSPTLAIAYLMHHERIPFQEAYSRVKSLRPKISPNFNFIGQLTNFERRLDLSAPAVAAEAPSPMPLVPTIVIPCQSAPPPPSPSQSILASTTPSLPPENVPKIVHPVTSTATTTTAVTIPIPIRQGPARPMTLPLRRPSLKPLVVVGSSGIGSKKRDRPSPSCSSSSPPVESGVFTSNTTGSSTSSSSTITSTSIFVNRRKRSRFGPLLPSPSTAIANLVLSSPSEEKPCQSRLTSNSPPPPPPSPRPRRLRVDDTRRFSLSAFTDLAGAALAAAAVAVAAVNGNEDTSSDIDSEVGLGGSSISLGHSGSSPSVLTSTSARWMLGGDSCRHQQATAESSCHSSLSSSSNSQHTPSFPIS